MNKVWARLPRPYKIDFIGNNVFGVKTPIFKGILLVKFLFPIESNIYTNFFKSSTLFNLIRRAFRPAATRAS